MLKDLQQFEPIIKAEAHKHNIQGMDWEDIAQEIRIKLWQKEKLFNPIKSSYKTWANKVMKNCIKDLIKGSQRKKQTLNRAISIEELQKNGLDIDNNGKICKIWEE